MIYLHKIDELYCQVQTNNNSILMELSDNFTFLIPNAKHHPKVKNGWWDGKIRLYNTRTGLLYLGLANDVKAFCTEHSYPLHIDDDVFALPDKDLFTEKQISNTLYESGLKLKLYDYQSKMIAIALQNRKALFLSPTSSGKSLIIYGITKILSSAGNKCLIIVPRKMLVDQLYNDLDSYNETSKMSTHKINSPSSKNISADVTITTWQSIYKMPKTWFDKFDAVLCDEAHFFAAKSLLGIIEKMNNCQYKFGFTGTLSGSKTHEMVLRGIIGDIHNYVTTDELTKKGIIAPIKIKCVVLKHSLTDLPKSKKFLDYATEIDYLSTSESKNKFIVKLACALKGNTIIFFTRKKQGQMISDMLQKRNRPFFYIDGQVPSDKRDEIRQKVENMEDAIIVASYGTTSTGVNIVNLHNAIFASPYKSKITVLQSIGRILRKSKTKDSAVLYDIADDLRKTTSMNITLRHLFERIKIYSKEKFSFQIYKMDI